MIRAPSSVPDMVARVLTADFPDALVSVAPSIAKMNTLKRIYKARFFTSVVYPSALISPPTAQVSDGGSGAVVSDMRMFIQFNLSGADQEKLYDLANTYLCAAMNVFSGRREELQGGELCEIFVAAFDADEPILESEGSRSYVCTAAIELRIRVGERR